MNMLKPIFAPLLAAMTMTLSAQVEQTAKVVVEDSGQILRFVYDKTTPSGTKNTDWFLVSDAERTGLNPPWHGLCETVTAVVFKVSFGDYRPTDCYRWFGDFKALAKIDGIKKYLDTSAATSMAYMFQGCSSLTSLDLSGFDTANVTDMNGMFHDCTALQKILVSEKFVTKAVAWSSNMFNGCRNLVGGEGTTYDDTKVNKVYARRDRGPSEPGYFTDFRVPKVLAEGVDLTTLRFVYDGKDYPKEERGLTWFRFLDGLAPEGVQSWSTAKHAIVTKVIFDPSFADYRPLHCGSWFYDFHALGTIEGIENLNTSRVTSFLNMFNGCSQLGTLDLSSFDTSKLTNMSRMFRGCNKLRVLDLSSFDTSNVEWMMQVFEDCIKLQTVYVSGKFDASRVSRAGSYWMFHNCLALKGGMGTAYAGTNPEDRTYARIDAGESAPGYFTYKGPTLSEDSYGILFVPNGGTGSMDEMICERGKVRNLTKCAFTAPLGKTFAGWLCSNGKCYDDGVLVFDLAESAQWVLMTAVWK